MGPVVEVYWDSDGTWRGPVGSGCYRARIRGRPSVHDAGDTRWRAIDNLLMTARSHGLLEGGCYAVEDVKE